MLLKQTADVDKDIRFENRTPNQIFEQMTLNTRAEMRDVHNVNLSMIGRGNDPRQSAKAKQNEITQGMIAQAPYIENYTNFHLNITQLLCDMLPYCVNESQVVEIQDEFGKKVGPIDVNVKEFDARGEEAKIVVNDLTSAKYRVVPILSDDSATNREKEYDDFIRMIEATGNSVFQANPRIIANVWSHLPNRFAKEAAQGLEQIAQMQEQQAGQQQQAEKAVEAQKEMSKNAMESERIKRPRWNIRLQPSDYQDAPDGFKMMMETLARINQAAPQQAAGAPVAQPVAA